MAQATRQIDTALPQRPESSQPATPSPARQPWRPAARRHARRQRRRLLFLIPAAVFLSAMALYPAITLVRMSLSQVDAGNLLGSWHLNSFQNFGAATNTPDFREALVNTLEFVVVVTAASLLLGFLSAVVLKKPSRPRRILQTIMIFAWALPPVVTGSLWKFLFASDGAINALLGRQNHPIYFLADWHFALWSVAAVTVWVSVPFVATVIRAALLDLPASMLEAAELDGASSVRRMRYIILPSIKPTLLTLSVLIIVYVFRSFDFIYVMTSGGPGTSSTTLPFLGYKQAFAQFLYGQGAATAVISMGIVLVLAVMYLRASRKEAIQS